MPHTCEDCEETFGTLTELRTHDCPGEDETAVPDFLEERAAERQKQKEREDRTARRRAPDELPQHLQQARDGDQRALHTALGLYERYLTEEWNNYEEAEYWGGHRVFSHPAVEAVETALDSEGWPLLLDLVDAYWPDIRFDTEGYSDHEQFVGDETDEHEDFPHISDVLVTVTAKELIRTRRTDGVEAIPTEALEYLRLFHRHPGNESPWLESMSYGWGIGHPEHPVAETIETLVEGEYEIWAGTAIEHAMHADQHEATALLESLFDAGIVSDPITLFRILGNIERGKYPDGTSDWEWETLSPETAGTGPVWNEQIHDRLRTVVEDSGFARQLPEDWSFTDIVL